MVWSLHKSLRWSRRGFALGLLATLVTVAPAEAREGRADSGREGRQRFRSEMPQTVRADHPAITPIADAIRQVTPYPLEQLVAVERATRLLVEYDSDERVYQRREYHATLDEMIERRRAAGWAYLRDDCDGRAVFAAHLLAALEIPWRLEASYWKGHAWVSATVDGVRYDLLDLRPSDPELQVASYRIVGRFFTRPSRPPPAFAVRHAWWARTGGDAELGVRLGLIERSGVDGERTERFAVNWLNRDQPAKADRSRGELGGSTPGE